MFFSGNFCAPDLEAFKNKPHQVLEFRQRNIPEHQQCRCSNFKPDFDLDEASISQN